MSAPLHQELHQHKLIGCDLLIEVVSGGDDDALILLDLVLPQDEIDAGVLLGLVGCLAVLPGIVDG